MFSWVQTWFLILSSTAVALNYIFYTCLTLMQFCSDNRSPRRQERRISASTKQSIDQGMEASYSAMYWGRSTHICYICDATVLSAHTLPFVHLYMRIFHLHPGGSDGKESACNVGELGSIPWSGRSLGERNGCPLQYFCLENSMDKGARWATVHRVSKSWAQLRD